MRGRQDVRKCRRGLIPDAINNDIRTGWKAVVAVKGDGGGRSARLDGGDNLPDRAREVVCVLGPDAELVFLGRVGADLSPVYNVGCSANGVNGYIRPLQAIRLHREAILIRGLERVRVGGVDGLNRRRGEDGGRVVADHRAGRERVTFSRPDVERSVRSRDVLEDH